MEAEAKMTSECERAARNRANAELHEVGKKYHDGIPVDVIGDLLEKYGFDVAPLEGIYCGEEGRLHEQVGPRTWIAMTWHKMEMSGRYEIVAYLS